MAVRFDASGEQYTRSLSLGSVTDFTVTCWARLAVNRGTTTVLWQIDNGSGGSRLRINAWDGTALTYQTDSGGWFGLVGQVMTVGTWYFVGLSATANPGLARVRIREAGSTTWVSGSVTQTNVTVNAATLRLGTGQEAGSWLNGSLAAVKVWSTALAVEELEQESWTYLPRRPANLRAWYPLLTPSAVDFSSNGQTLSGGSGVAADDGPPLTWSAAAPVIVRSRVEPPGETPKTLEDGGSASDTLAANVAAILAESGSAADGLSVTVSPALTDSGSSAQALATAATVALADSASSAQTFTTGVPRPVGDAGSAADSFTANAAATLAQAASAADALSASVTLALTDSGTAADAFTGGQLLAKTLGDSAAAADALTAQISREITGAGAPYMAWAAGEPEVRWAAGQPYSPWSAAASEMSWSASPPSTRYSAGPPVLEEV